MYVSLQCILSLVCSTEDQSSHQDITSASNALFNDIVTNIDDCVTITENQCYEPVASYPQYNKPTSSETWQIIVVEEVSNLRLMIRPSIDITHL